MNNMVLEHYANRVGNKRFNVSFRDRLTVVMGDSGTGRTLLWMKLASESAFRDDIVCFNYTAKVDILHEIKKRSNTLFVFDNADIILTPETKRYIQEDKSNQYILFGRDTDGLKLAAINIAELVVIGDEIKLNYFMMSDNKRID